MKLQKTQKGFTLIELLVTIAIIAILATIAVPAYQRFIERAKYSEVTQSVNPVKAWVEDCYQQNGVMTACPSPAPVGITNGASAALKVTSVLWNGSQITATSNGAEFPDSGSQTFIITSSTNAGGGVDWSIHATSGCISAGLCTDDGGW